MKSTLTVLSLIFVFSFELQAFQDHEHGSASQEADSAQYTNGTTQTHQTNADTTKGWDHPESVTADFEDFPNLHPLFVHFPVALLPFAAFFQILGLFVYKKEMSWVVMILVLVGFIAGYIAANFVHPHVGNLPEHAQQVYDMHDTYATWTLWLSGIAILLKVGSHFFLNRKRWAEGVVALVLLGSAITVSMAGHYGSQLVFIEGIGPQGEYLESGEHSH